MTTRRTFLASILAAGAAPALCRASVLMPVRSLLPCYAMWVDFPMYGGPIFGAGGGGTILGRYEEHSENVQKIHETDVFWPDRDVIVDGMRVAIDRRIGLAVPDTKPQLLYRETWAPQRTIKRPELSDILLPGYPARILSFQKPTHP